MLGHQIAQIFDEANEYAVPGRVRERGVECRVEVDPGTDIVGALERIGQRLDVVGAPQWVGHIRDAGLVGQDLLGTQRNADRLLGG